MRARRRVSLSERNAPFAGTRLDELYKALCGHRVLRITEAPDGFAASNDGAFVEAIEVSAV